jgi:hypothetical protein
MLKLSLINPYDPSLNHRVLGDINFDTNSTIDLTLSQLALNQPYKLDITFNSDFPYYNDIVSNPKFNSLKIQTDYVNLGFIMADGKRRVGLQNSYTLFSSSQKLARLISYPDQAYTGSLSGFLANLSQDFVYTSISTEPNTFTIETAFKNDLELLTEAVTRVDFFAWRENGLIDVGGGVLKPQILYGNFGADINTYYNASPATRKECQPLEAYKTTSVDDSFNANVLQIDDIVENFAFNYYNRLFIFSDTGQGMALNSRLNVIPNTVDSVLGVTVNPQFPLFPIVKNGVTYYYLQVPGVSTEPIQEKALIYSSSSNTENSGGSLLVTPASSAQRAYQDGINYARSQITNNYYSITEGSLKRICLPGNTANIRYKEDVEGGIDLQTDFLLNPIKDLDLTNIQN